MINIRLPNITANSEREQLLQVNSYLHQLVQELNWALSTIEAGNSTASKTGDKLSISYQPGNGVFPGYCRIHPKQWPVPVKKESRKLIIKNLRLEI